MSKQKDWADEHPTLFFFSFFFGLILSLIIDIIFYDHHLEVIYLLIGIAVALFWVNIMGTKNFKIAYIYVFLIWPLMIPLTIAWFIKGRPKYTKRNVKDPDIKRVFK